MNELEQQNTAIINEAKLILNDLGLHQSLNKYGKAVPWGSYVLELMTWRDLDMYLETNEMTEGKFFQLGSEIASLLKPYRMQYRNEHIGKTPGNPDGLYWGVFLSNALFPEEWKIDVWAISSEQLSAFRKQFNTLKQSIDLERRAAILLIKNHCWKHPEYRRGFSSMDIYNAVIEEDIKSIKDFARWLKANRGIVV